MLIDSRVKEIMEFWPKIIPLPYDKNSDLGKMASQLDEVSNALMKKLAKMALEPQNRGDAESIFEWMLEGIMYMKGESDDFPATELAND